MLISCIWVWGGIWPSGSWIVLFFPAIVALIIWRRSPADTSARRLRHHMITLACGALCTLVSVWLVFLVDPFSNSRLKRVERQKVEFAGHHVFAAIYDKAFEEGQYPDSLDELIKSGRLKPATQWSPSPADEVSWFDYKGAGLPTASDAGIVILASKDVLHDGSRLLVFSDGKHLWVSGTKLKELQDRIDAKERVPTTNPG
jgi:hypothetical protein